jgi:hypothetical protein
VQRLFREQTVGTAQRVGAALALMPHSLVTWLGTCCAQVSKSRAASLLQRIAGSYNLWPLSIQDRQYIHIARLQSSGAVALTSQQSQAKIVLLPVV